jgi:hypothetical protein
LVGAGLRGCAQSLILRANIAQAGFRSRVRVEK